MKLGKKSNPLVTIITVCYNAETTIEKTILNVINQTYADIEYIIIDGGSNDGTIEIINKYANKISYWMSEPDRGIYDAMNKGIKLAKGDWVSFMNSGDSFYSLDTVEDVVQFIREEYDVIYGSVNVVCDSFRRLYILK
ncbi:glycosyltransferase family 2 protein [Bacteroides fragilis]|nr:glycosyltransferase family 2 protein [Bacteroides fragilis]